MSNTTLSTWPFHDSFLSEMGNTNPVAKRNSRDRSLIKRALNHKHMIETVERFEWTGLPPEIPNDLIERILYFRFKGSLFKFNDRFVFLPFTLKGEGEKTIDSYGRYTNITPVLFTGQWKVSGDGEINDDIAFVTDKTFAVVYDLPADQEKKSQLSTETENQDTEPKEKIDQKLEGETTDVVSGIPDAENKAVILTDSTLEISQDYTPMAYLARPFVEQLTDILVLVNIDLITSAKVFYVVAKDADQKDAIEKEFANLDDRILNGKRIVVVTSPTKLEELNGGNAKDTARYFQSYQSIDNLRKDLIGQDNGGTFMKQEHTTEMETETNSNSGSAVLNNALRMRKDFCAIVKKVFGLDIQVEIKGGSEKPIVADKGAQSIDREGDEE